MANDFFSKPIGFVIYHGILLCHIGRRLHYLTILTALPAIDSLRAFSISRVWAQLATCYSLFPSKSMCKTITVDGEGKGVRGGKCGKPTSNSLSFSITKSVATKHPVYVTSPHIARGCRPVVQLYYRPISAYQMDGQFAIYDECGGDSIHERL